MEDEARFVRDLIGDGWSDADLEWERLSLQALSDLGEGREQEAFTAIREALYLARTYFAAGDPRLAASLTSQAAALAAADPSAPIDVVVEAAKQAWQACEGALAEMTPPQRARSSLFHLRMEYRHRATYAERWREENRRQLTELRTCLARVEAPVLIERAEARVRIAHWERERPTSIDDAGRLLAAFVLLAARPAHGAPRPEENAGLR